MSGNSIFAQIATALFPKKKFQDKVVNTVEYLALDKAVKLGSENLWLEGSKKKKTTKKRYKCQDTIKACNHLRNMHGLVEIFFFVFLFFWAEFPEKRCQSGGLSARPPSLHSKYTHIGNLKPTKTYAYAFLDLGPTRRISFNLSYREPTFSEFLNPMPARPVLSLLAGPREIDRAISESRQRCLLMHRPTIKICIRLFVYL